MPGVDSINHELCCTATVHGLSVKKKCYVVYRTYIYRHCRTKCFTWHKPATTVHTIIHIGTLWSLHCLDCMNLPLHMTIIIFYHTIFQVLILGSGSWTTGIIEWCWFDVCVLTEWIEVWHHYDVPCHSHLFDLSSSEQSTLHLLSAAILHLAQLCSGSAIEDMLSHCYTLLGNLHYFLHTLLFLISLLYWRTETANQSSYLCSCWTFYWLARHNVSTMCCTAICKS